MEEFFERFRREIRRIIREFEEELEELRPMWDVNGALEPLISITKRPDKYIVLVDLPYADLNALSIEVKGRRVVIECSLSNELRFERWSAYGHTKFNRYHTEFLLPEDIDPTNIIIEKDDEHKVVRIIVPRKIL